MLKLHNTRTRQLDNFEPHSHPQVTLYTCGPTVYDHLHIGNWLAYIRWDTLVRTLQAAGYKVQRVMNITDVGHLTSDADEGEDKLESGAKREGRSAWQVAKTYTDDFFEGAKLLNLLPPAIYAKATEHIPEQIELIKQLEAKGFTYSISDGIYFDISKFPAYSDFAQLDLADQKEGARVAPNPEKKHPQDFALWKFSPAANARDMEWDSPWGKGFPGWHLECSAMAMKYLGETLDIHTGGIDHIPVHHTNEIAQSEGATGKRFANFWLHNNFLLVDGTKISKSLSNGFTLQDLEKKGYSALDFKMLALQSHYRTEANFSWDVLQSAQAKLAKLSSWADLVHQIPPLPTPSQTETDELLNNIARELENDLNTPRALAVLNQAVDSFAPTKDLLNKLDDLLGLSLASRPDISTDQKELIDKRETARKTNDWTASDKLRVELLKHGLEINDTASGPVWSRRNSS